MGGGDAGADVADGVLAAVPSVAVLAFFAVPAAGRPLGVGAWPATFVGVAD